MGLFRIEEDTTSIEAIREHADEVKELAKESLAIAKHSTDEIFPDFLWKPQLNEFEGDDYKLRGTCEDPAILEAYKLKRKYSDFWDFLNALSAYRAYMDYLDSAFGSSEMMIAAAAEGLTSIYVPKMPKLTNKQVNRMLVNSGIIPSRQDLEAVVPDDIIAASLDEVEEAEIEDRDLTPEELSMRDSAYEEKARTDRLNSVFAAGSSKRTIQGMDAIVHMLNSGIAETSFDDLGKGKQVDIVQTMIDMHADDYIPEDVIEDRARALTGIMKNRIFVRASENDRIEIIEALEKNGYQFLNSSATEGMNRQAIRAITSRYGQTNLANMTQKERKQYLLRLAASRQQHARSIAADRRIDELLRGNKITLERTSDPLSNFRLSDLIPDD